MTTFKLSIPLLLIKIRSSCSRNGMTGVIMPYVKPSENIAMQIVASIKPLELLKDVNCDSDMMLTVEETTRKLIIMLTA